MRASTLLLALLAIGACANEGAEPTPTTPPTVALGSQPSPTSTPVVAPTTPAVPSDGHGVLSRIRDAMKELDSYRFPFSKNEVGGPGAEGAGKCPCCSIKRITDIM